VAGGPFSNLQGPLIKGFSRQGLVNGEEAWQGTNAQARLISLPNFPVA
jgi:hypothetical protein